MKEGIEKNACTDWLRELLILSELEIIHVSVLHFSSARHWEQATESLHMNSNKRTSVFRTHTHGILFSVKVFSFQKETACCKIEGFLIEVLAMVCI